MDLYFGLRVSDCRDWVRVRVFKPNSWPHTPNANMADHSDGPGQVARKRGYCGLALFCFDCASREMLCCSVVVDLLCSISTLFHHAY